MRNEENVLIESLNDNPENIIFLDIDGVLNNDSSMLFYKYIFDEKIGVDRRSLDILKHICDIYGAKIVLSSSYRLGFDSNMNPKSNGAVLELNKLFMDNNIKVIGKTDNKSLSNDKWDRPRQIVNYVNKYLRSFDKWVALDDENLLGRSSKDIDEILKEHFIKTDCRKNGLDYNTAKQIMNIFSSEE